MDELTGAVALRTFRSIARTDPTAGGALRREWLTPVLLCWMSIPELLGLAFFATTAGAAVVVTPPRLPLTATGAGGAGAVLPFFDPFCLDPSRDETPRDATGVAAGGFVTVIGLTGTATA